MGFSDFDKFELSDFQKDCDYSIELPDGSTYTLSDKELAEAHYACVKKWQIGEVYALFAMDFREGRDGSECGLAAYDEVCEKANVTFEDYVTEVCAEYGRLQRKYGPYESDGDCFIEARRIVDGMLAG